MDLTLPLDRNRPAPLWKQLVERIGEMIDSNALGEGAKGIVCRPAGSSPRR